MKFLIYANNAGVLKGTIHRVLLKSASSHLTNDVPNPAIRGLPLTLAGISVLWSTKSELVLAGGSKEVRSKRLISAFLNWSAFTYVMGSEGYFNAATVSSRIAWTTFVQGTRTIGDYHWMTVGLWIFSSFLIKLHEHYFIVLPDLYVSQLFIAYTARKCTDK